MATRLVVLASAALAGACVHPHAMPPDDSATPSADASIVRRFEFSTETTIPASLTVAGALDVWIPLPAENGMQRPSLLELAVAPADAPADAPAAGMPEGVRAERAREERDGNAMLHVTLPAGLTGDVSVRTTWLVERDALPTARGAPDGSGRQDAADALAPDRLVPLDGEIAALAAGVPDGQDADAIARALFDLVRERMEYDKQAPGWGQGDAVRACDVGKGNCTDFHALFIGLARAKGIPARFTIGYSLPETRTSGEPLAGYHCWAEYRSPARGWVPVDISEADKAPDRELEYFGRLTTNRIAISSGRDLVLSPPQRGEPLNYFIGPYAERDGAPVEGLVHVVSARDTESRAEDRGAHP
jgi:transglutaminase-like putative cysteine protease